MTRQFSFQSRDAALELLGSTDFDFLVVGGGVTGTGIARDAALRGFRVALVDMGDFGSGTSSKSSKLVHGGLRYLEQYDFKLVFEGTSERARLMKQAPHIVRPLPFLFPIYEESSRGPLLVNLGLWLYDALALFRNYRNHRRLDAAEAHTLEPGLRQAGLRAGMLYYDCITDDARLTLENAISAHQAGACVTSYVRLVRGQRDAGGHITGALCHDELSGREVAVKASVVINAAGPWTDRVLDCYGADVPRMLRPTKGIHLVFERSKLPVEHAVVMSSIRDGRVVFAIPWEHSTVVGTTDTDYDGDIDTPAATAEDAQYLCETLAVYFPDTPLCPDDVVCTWAGLRPLVRDDGSSPYDTSREHTIVADPSGTVTIAGGKLTTYRKMADECVREAMALLPARRRQGPRDCQTEDAPLPGAVGFDYRTQLEQTVGELCARGVGEEEARHLLSTYGAAARSIAERVGRDASAGERLDPRLPFIRAELDHAIEHEMALTLEDFLVRRTHLYYHALDQGLSLVPELADRMAAAMGWSPATKEREIARYMAVVARSRQFRGEMADRPRKAIA